MRDRLNWPLVLGTTIVGVSAIFAGVWIEEFDAQVWSSVLIQVGAAVGLLSMLVVLERRVVKRVAEKTVEAVESTTQAEVQRATTDLRERVERLEDLDAAQQRELDSRRRVASERIGRIREGDISRSSIGELLASAARDRLIDQHDFKVRTGPDPACPVLYILPFVDSRGVVGVFFDFVPFVLAPEPVIINGAPIQVPQKTDSNVLWRDESPASIAADLLAGLERRNQPTETFGFGHALDMLTKSVEIMRNARAAAAGSPLRLEGQLRTMINDDWVYTTHGLESVASPLSFEEKTHIDPRRSRNSHRAVQVPAAVEEVADSALKEALTWLQEREHVGSTETIRGYGSAY